jgi:hypothetical protein
VLPCGPGVRLELLDNALETGDLHFELGDAFGQIARFSGGVDLRGLREGDAHLLAVAPDDMGAQRLFFLRNVEVEHVRSRHSIGKNQPRAIGRDIADQAIDDIAAVVEIDHAAQKAFLAGDLAAFDSAAFGLTGHGANLSEGV